MNVIKVVLSVLIFTTSFATIANDADIFNSIKIGGAFDNICGSSSEYCKKYEDIFTKLWEPTDPTYQYRKGNNEKILLKFDCFGYLYEKEIENFREPLSELIRNSVGEYLRIL